jgi:hypothetical protein
MKIIFSHHYKKRKTERDDYFLPTVRYVETADSIPNTERILRLKGKWHGRMDKEEGLYKLFCIVNNLEVYCGIIIDDVEPYILITTYWPYTSKMKRKLYPRGRDDFTPFDVNDTSGQVVESFCYS